MPEEVILKFDEVLFEYVERKPILDEVSFTVRTGSKLTLMGQNGAGKSTLLNSISGKIKTTNGKILLKSIPIQSLNKRERSKLISSLDQNPEKNCVPSLTVKENIALALLKEKKASLKNGLSIIKNSKVVKQINELFNDENILDKKMSELSGGQRQLIAFLMATAILPKILILDEPTDGFSAEQLQRLRDCLESIGLKQIIIVSHEAMMEGFVNHIINVEKRSGVSLVTQ